MDKLPPLQTDNDVSRIVTKFYDVRVASLHDRIFAWSPSPISNGTRALRRSALIALTMALHIWAALTMGMALTRWAFGIEPRLAS